MANYAPISDSQIDSDSILTQETMYRLRDNAIAIAEGAVGAPKNQSSAYAVASVNQAAIGANAVHRSELATTTASGSVSLGSAGAGEESTALFQLVGGSHSWWTPSMTEAVGIGGRAAAAGQIPFVSRYGNSKTAYINERYITASPPYDLGDGEVPIFVFAMLDSNKEIKAISVSHDPSWAYNGPTDVTPQYIDPQSGKKYRTMRVLEDEDLTLLQAKEQNSALYEEFKRGRKKLVDRQMEITTQFKNSDMNTNPHPWVGNDANFFDGNTVVMLNPFSNAVQNLCDISCEAGACEVREMFEQGYLDIKNECMNLCGPEGIAVVDFKFKNTI